MSAMVQHGTYDDITEAREAMMALAADGLMVWSLVAASKDGPWTLMVPPEHADDVDVVRAVVSQAIEGREPRSRPLTGPELHRRAARRAQRRYRG